MHKIWETIREASSLTVRVGEKIKDKFFWNKAEIQESKEYILLFIKEYNKNRKLKLTIKKNTITPFKKGFNTRSFLVDSHIANKQIRWVLKVGHRISPVVDFGDPSDPSHARGEWNNYKILRDTSKEVFNLPFFIVEPQIVKWIKHHKKNEGRTVIMQPFLHLVSKKEIHDLPSEVKSNLKKEVRQFEKLISYMEKKHHLFPDLLGEDNIAVVKHAGDEHHLVLLDTGMLDLHAPLPLTKMALFNAYKNEVERLKKLFD